MSPGRRLLLAVGALLAACGAASPLAIQPEADSGYRARPAQTFARQAVVAAHPLASEAGARLLRAGGNAVDAAIATQLVLGLVEPQSSGIGGGGFLIVWDGERSHAYDGRETAPAAADENLLLRPDGQPLPRGLAERSGLAVGVPGLLRLLETVHRRHGRLPWAQLFEPALQIADEGFALGERLHELLRVDVGLRQDPAALAMYYRADGSPLPVGSRVRNPAQAAILRQVAERGADAFYRGAVAEDLLRRVRGHERPGRMQAADLQGYRVLVRQPLCAPWRRWRLCGLPPPASGLLLNIQLLALYDAAGAPPAVSSEQGLHRYVEAARLAMADRDRYVADPDFMPQPLAGLTDPGYLRQRAARIGERAAEKVEAGRPAGADPQLAAQDEAVERGTTHLSVVDAEGRAVSLTSSVEAAFGSRILADGGTGLPGGYILNNQLTDFSARPRDAAGRAIANRVQPGKRPRSSMNPMLVFDGASGRLEMVLGSPGGLAIPHYTARVLLQTLGDGQSLQAAIQGPNWVPAGDRLFLEAERFAPGLGPALVARGHRPQWLALTSGLHALQRAPAGWTAVADPRREGSAAGD